MKQSGILGWLQRKTLPRPRRPWLPDPNESNVTNAPAFVAASDAVERMLDKEETASGRKRGSYHAYDKKIRAKITKLAEENGLMQGCRPCIE